MTTRPKPRSPHSRPHPHHQIENFRLEEPAIRRKQNNVKNHFVAASGEFVGTIMFLYFGFSTHLMAVDQASDVARSGGGKSAQTVVFISLGYAPNG